MTPMRSVLSGFNSRVRGEASGQSVGAGAPRLAPSCDLSSSLTRSERDTAGIVFERALIAEHEAGLARGRGVALAGAGVCGSAFQLARAAIVEKCGGSDLYACDLLSVIADEAHLPEGGARERFLDLVVPVLSQRHDRSNAVVSREIRRMRTLATKIIHYAANVPTALTRLLGLRGELPPLFVRLSGASDLTSTGAQDTLDFAIDAITALGRGAGPRRSTHRDALFDRPMVCVALDAIAPGLPANPDESVRRDVLGRLSALVGEARRSDVVLILDSVDEARLSAVLDLFLACRATPACAGWDGLGFTVTAASKRAVETLQQLHAASRQDGRKIPVRLSHTTSVATDLTWAVASGLNDYPVLTTPAVVSTSYVACARALISEAEAFRPIFDCASPAERGLLEAIATVSSYDVVTASHAFTQADPSAIETFSAGCARIGLEIGQRDHVLARWRDCAATPRLIAALCEDGSSTETYAAARYMDLPSDPVGDVGRLLDPSGEAAAPRVDVVALRAPNASAKGVLRAARAPVDQPGSFNDLSLVAIDPPANDTAETSGKPKPEAMWSPRPDLPLEGWARLPQSERSAILGEAADALHRQKADLLGVLVAAGLTVRDAEAEWLCIVETLRFVSRTRTTSPARTASRVGIACDVSYLFADTIAHTATTLAQGSAVTCLVPETAAPVFDLVVAALTSAGFPNGAVALDITRIEAATANELVKAHDALIVASGAGLQSRILKAHALAGNATLPVWRHPVYPSLALVDGTVSLSQAAAAIARSTASFAGQRPGALRTILVADDVADALTETLVDCLARLTLGHPQDATVTLGPMLDERLRDAAHAEKLRLMQSHELVFDGEFATELIAEPFVSPALFTAAGEMELIVPQVLGPLIGVTKVPADDLADGAEAALKLIASQQPWDTFAVFSSDERLFRAAAGQIRAKRHLHDGGRFGTASADTYGFTVGEIASARRLPRIGSSMVPDSNGIG